MNLADAIEVEFVRGVERVENLGTFPAAISEAPAQ